MSTSESPTRDRRVRMLLLLTSTAGGVGLHGLQLARGLPRDRFDLTVAFGPGYPLDAEFMKLDVPVRVLSIARTLSPMTNLRGLWQVWRLCARERFDIVCIEASMGGVVGRIGAWLAGVPARVMVLQVFASYPARGRARTMVFGVAERLLDRLTTKYIAVSNAMKQIGAERRLIDPARTEVIYNSAEVVEPFRRDEALRAELGITPGARVVATAGRCEKQKAFDDFLRMASIVRRSRPDTEFLLIGEGPELESLKRLARELGIQGAVRFTGWRTDAPRVIAQADVFAMSTLWESFCIVLAEAGLMRVPVVATRIDAIPEVIEDGVTGILSPPRDPGALARGVLRLLDDPELARRMGDAGRARVIERFSTAQMVRAYADVLERHANERRRGRGR